VSVESEAVLAPEAEAVPITSLPRRAWNNLRSGELGSAPIVFGIVAITIFFYVKSSTYVGASNFNNLIVQMAGVTIIAYGVVFVLLLGEIDLSIGSVSGVCAVFAAELQLAGSGHVLPGSDLVQGLLCIAVAIGAGAVIGAFQGSFVALIGVPSFVVTLAGLLAWQGVLFKALPESVITIQNSTINNVAGYYFSHKDGWIIAGIVSLLYAVTAFGGVIGRRRAKIATGNLPLVILKVLAVTGIAFFIVYKSNTDPGRGLPLAGVLVVALLVFWTFIAKRTTFGRHIYAVGGNAEAARRAGINVARIRIIVFAISGAMAALGGIVFAARVNGVNLSSGGGDTLLNAISAAVIGGTSLFGGRGYVRSALLGGLIIAMISNGIDLVGYSPATKLITTGVILLLAVTLDTISRRRLEASGR
jgi:D-xylose transport system permease protein